MKEISPLKNIEKNGLFGNYQNKDEDKLITINEVTNIKIYQIVKFKSSSIDSTSISIDDQILPINPNSVSGNKITRILWNAPNTWLIISSDKDISKKITDVCSEIDFAITNLSHSRAIVQIQGERALDVIKKGSPLNLNNFKKNDCRTSVYHGITFTIDMVEDTQIILNLMANRSFSESFYHAITDSALEYGYKKI
jgi:sarcosine oxidase subunit gamma